MALTCELCGSTNFVKTGGLFVCQACGMKYTLEEAQRLMANAVQAPVQTTAPSSAAPTSSVDVNAALNAVAGVMGAIISSSAQAPALDTTNDFSPSSIDVASLGAKETNNYVCRAWQMLLKEYKGLEHASESQQKVLVSRAQECLTLLDDAAMLEPNNHVLRLLIFENCKEIVESTKNTHHYVQDEEGNWKRKGLDYSIKVGIPGQKESFDKKAETERKILEQRYLDANPAEVLQREKLVAQAEEINGRLNELKAEKKSHGFFDFSGKREVKDRMKPVEEELREVRGQINKLDDKVDDYVDQLVRDLGKTHVLLDF